MQAASEKFAALGLPKLNDYDSKRGSSGGRGGGRGGFSSRGGRGGFHGCASSSAAQKPVRQRTLERKLKRQKGTNRMVDRDSGKMIGNAAHLAERREHMKAKMQVASGELEAMPPKKKKAKLSAESTVKKGSLLPNAANANPAPLPEFLMNSNFGRVDENGEKPWDLEEEMRFYEQALGVRKLKNKKKKAAAEASKSAKSTEGEEDGNESDDAELDTNALSKLRTELDEDGLGDLFDFCDMLEKDGGEDMDGDDFDQDASEEIDEDTAVSEKKNKKKKDKKDDGEDYSERQREILEAEARIDRKQDKMEKALAKAMADAESKSKEKQTQLQKINKKHFGFGGVEITDSEEESESEEEDGEDDDDEDDDEDEEMMGMEMGEDEEDEMMEDEEEQDDSEDDEEDETQEEAESQLPKSRKRAREEAEEDEEVDEDEDDVEAENEDDEAEAEGAEVDEEADEEAAEEDDAEGEAEGESKSAEEAPKRKGLTVNEMYGFDAPLPESLLAFRRGEKNILANATGTAATTASNSSATATAPVLAKYVPPHLRAQMAAAAASGASSSAAASSSSAATTDAAHQTKLAALRRQLKGLLNRLTSANLEHIAIQIQSNLYSEHSKREVTDILCEEMLSLCTAEADGSSAYAVGVNSSTLLASAALVTFLHASVGADIGAHFLEKFVLAFRELFEAIITRATTQPSSAASSSATTMKLAATQMRSCSTVVTFLTYLYNFELVSSLLINELIREFLSRTAQLTGEGIELLLIVLQNCGYQLRKDDPVALKEIILQIQNQSKILMNQASTSSTDNTKEKEKSKEKAAAPTSGSHIPEGRVAFMLDMIYDLKNNKKRHSSIYESILPLQNWLSGKLKRKSAASGGDLQLRFGLYDIYNIQQKGRWWLVGSAWKGKRMGEEEGASKGASSDATTKSFSDKSANGGKINLPKEEGTDNVDLLSLARAQHMNTDVRKSLFLVIMSAVDYMDCYEKLCKLNLPPSQFRQVIKVLLDCCANEKKFNPYYAYVALQLCRMEGGKEMKFTLTLSYWDYIKDEWSDEALKKSMKQKNIRSPAQKDEFMMTINRRALNLARFLSLLLRENAHVGGTTSHKGNASGGVTFNVFKTLNFQDMSTVQLLFLTSCLKEFLLNTELPQINQTMLRLHSQIYEKKKSVSSGKKGADESGANKQEEMTLLRDGMDYFLQHHLLPTAQTMARNKENAKMKEQGASLKQRIQSARKALSGQADEDWMFKK